LVCRLPLLAHFPYTALFRSRKRDGKGFDLEDALFEISKCGGLVLYDQVTGGCVTLTVQNGVLVVDADPSSSETYGTATYIIPNRSEEHTSELQSRENLVCRL